MACLRLLAAALLVATPVAAQQAPRPLIQAPSPEAAPPPALPPPPSQADAPITVESLAAPTLASLGLANAETELGGQLWAEGTPPALMLLLGRLPSNVADPTLRALQKALLGAPGPAGSARELFLLRVDDLLAMAEPGAAADLLAMAPEGTRDAEVELRRLEASFALGRTDPGCAVARAQEQPDWPWPQARIVCAALAGDAAAVQTGLDLLDARGAPADDVLAGLAQAAATGARFTLHEPFADDPLLLPLLGRVPIDVDPKLVAELPAPARRALADNPDLAAAARAAAAGPPRPGPSVRPELNGRAPTDWTAAMDAIPAAQRPRWLALADGLGLDVPESIWTELYGVAAAPQEPAPDLLLWRGFEVARAAGQRGAMLLYVLLLLDGRPEAAAPITLRRSLDALNELGLDDAARALAAGTGGALGL